MPSPSGDKLLYYSSDSRAEGLGPSPQHYGTSLTAALKAIDELLEEGYTFVMLEEILFD